MGNENEELLKNSQILLEIARDAIAEKLKYQKRIDKKRLLQRYPVFNDERATFVTLTLDGQLRGCIGSIVPQRSLYEDIIYNAKASAFEDPRFYPLSQEEFEYVQIEISLLTIPTLLNYVDINDLKSKISIGEHGVILAKGEHHATFLPQVWEQLTNFEDFFSHLCQKAGLSTECLKDHPEVYVYKALKVK